MITPEQYSGAKMGKHHVFSSSDVGISLPGEPSGRGDVRRDLGGGCSGVPTAGCLPSAEDSGTGTAAGSDDELPAGLRHVANATGHTSRLSFDSLRFTTRVLK